MEDPMPKMRRMDDDRPAMMRQSPDYDRRPSYMEEEQDHFRSDHRSGPMMGRMPDDINDRQRKVVSIFDINDRLRREDVEDRGMMAGAGNRLGPERFGNRRIEEEDMMTMQRGRTLMRGSAEPRRGSWDDRASEREQTAMYDNRMQDDRRMPPKNPPVPSLLDTMDRGNREFLSDRRQQRMSAVDSMMVRDQGTKRPGRELPSAAMQDDTKQSTYYQNVPANMTPARQSISEHGSLYDRDDRSSWTSERSDRFRKFESEGTQATKRQSNQSNQPAQSSEQSDPVSLLLNLSQLLA